MNDWVSLGLGALVSEGLKLVIREAKNVLAFESVSKELASTMESLLPIITQIEAMQDVGELKNLKDTIVEALVVVRESSSVQQWKIVRKSKYTRKIKKINEKLLKFCQVQLQALQYRKQLQSNEYLQIIMNMLDRWSVSPPIEVVKFLQASSINQDLHMYDSESGTLTFLKCSIAGTSYGDDEVESVFTASDETDSIKGFSFEDCRLTNGNWFTEAYSGVILMFFRILAVCHTGNCSYEAESPDEVAFLVAAREFGFGFSKRTQSSVFIKEYLPPSWQPVDREYKILNLLDFTSKRKRMSIIVRDEEGQILLLCKGAHSIIFDRLSKEGKKFLGPTSEHLNAYGEAGLRTLALGYRNLDETEYSAWNNEFHNAKTSVGADRDEMLDKVSDVMEKELILVGATAVEDKGV